MRINTLNDFIKGNLTKEEFSKELSKEIFDFEKSKNTLGSTLIIVGDFNDVFDFNDDMVKQLLKKYISSGIKAIELEYILNYIELSCFKISNKTEEIITSLSIPEINYSINIENVKKCIDFLNEDTKILILN